MLRWYVVPLPSGEHHATGTNITFRGTPNGHESTGVRKNKQHEVNHTPSPGQLSVAAAVVFSILGAILVAAVILIVIGVLHKHYSKRRAQSEALTNLATPLVSKPEGEAEVEEEI